MSALKVYNMHRCSSKYIMHIYAFKVYNIHHLLLNVFTSMCLNVLSALKKQKKPTLGLLATHNF
jgi:hypothetical protein